MQSDPDIVITTFGKDMLEITSEETDINIGIERTQISWYRGSALIEKMKLSKLAPELRFDFEDVTVSHCQALFQRAVNQYGW